MAHSGGKIYVDTSVTPNVGISISDIQTVLGYPRHPVTGDVINDIGGLITYGDINIFAKYKPVRINSLTHPNQNWWKSDNCGLNAYGEQNYENLVSMIESSDPLNGWQYYRPLGASAQIPSWFRILDFDGYNQDADAPVADFSIERPRLNYGEELALIIPVGQDDTDSLTPSDITIDSVAMSSLYLGAYIVQQSGGTRKTVKAVTSLSQGAGRLTVSTTGWTAGTYKIYPFLSTAYIEQTSQFTGEGEFYTIPYTTAQEFEIGDFPNHVLTFNSATLVSKATGSMTFWFRFSNMTLGAYLRVLTVKLRDPAKAYNDPINADPEYDYFERQWIINNNVTAQTTTAVYTSISGDLRITVTYNQSTQELTGNATVTMTDGMLARVNNDPSYRPVMWIRFIYSGDGQTYTKSGQVAIPQD